jgi:hypothetical protein
MDNLWDVKIRRGWIVGLILMVVLLVATIGAVVIAVIRPINLGTFLLGLAALLTLGLAIRVGYQLWGLINAGYEMDRNALIIRWGGTMHQIPMGSVQNVYSGSQLEGLRLRLSLRWPGYMVTVGQSAGLDTIVFYATRPVSEQVIVVTDHVAYALSPADADEFLRALLERLEMGPTQEVEERAVHPAFLKWDIWHDRWAMGTLLGSLFLAVFLTGLLCWRYPYLPESIAMRVTTEGEPMLMAPPTRIFYFALLAGLFFVINGGLGLITYHHTRAIAYMLWSGLVAVEGSLWAAVISVLTRQPPPV